jgi:hypothetical protein
MSAVATSRASCASEDCHEKGVAGYCGRGGFLFGIFTTLGTAVGDGTAFDFAASLFFDDAEGTEGLLFMFFGHCESIKRLENLHIFELLELNLEFFGRLWRRTSGWAGRQN